MTWHYRVTDGYGWASQYGQEQTDNAQEIWSTLRLAGWTEEATSAVLGNFQAESFINPGQWEIGYNYSMSRGTGLGQWTPATKVSNIVGSSDRDAMADGAKQLVLLLNTPGQFSTYYFNPDGSSTYYHESGLPYISSMSEFSQSHATVEELTKIWAMCWERPGSSYYTSSKGRRIEYASHWYAEFTGQVPVQPPNPEPVPQPTPPPTPVPPIIPTPQIPPTVEEVEAIISIFLAKRRKKKRY